MKDLNAYQRLDQGKFGFAAKKTQAFGAALIILFLSTSAYSVSVPVPNGDFSVPGNFGSVGGGLIGASGTSPIGTGPWAGTYQGVAVFLAPPTLTISAGKASISGLLGINVGGILNNRANFSVVAGTAFLPNRRYTISADVDVGGALNVGALTSGNAGIAITNAGSRLASSATSSNVSLDLVSGNRYRLQLTHDTGATVSGNVGVDLFAEPSGLLGASLSPTVNFSSVTVSQRLINQVPATVIDTSSGPHTPVVGSVLAGPLSVKVLDTQGDPIAGLPVNWTAPTTGPSATLSPTMTLTNSEGIGSVTATANTIAGSYQIAATVSGVSPSTMFDMTNVAGAPAAMSVLTGPVQQAEVNQPFATPLTIRITDQYGNVNQAVTATFSAPASGASAILSATSIQTGNDGTAQITATANGLAGTYAITAQVGGTTANASFSFTNLLPATVVPLPAGQPDQNGAVNQIFGCAIVVRVSDQSNNPLAGLAVDFISPGSGPSATLQSGASSGLSLRVMTDADGLAWVNPTANGIMGEYNVIAQLAYSAYGPTLFSMTNLAVGDPQYSSGFDGPCLTPGALEDTASE